MSGFRTLDLNQLYALELPDLRWIVSEMLPAGSVTLLTGREKSGKTLLATDLLCSVAVGEPFLDRAVEPGSVLFMPAEEHLREVRSRIQTRLNGIDAPVTVAPVGGQLDGQRLCLDVAESMEMLAATVQAIQPVAMVIDPLRETHAGTENDSDSMAPLLRPVRQMAHELDTAILLLHHASKGGGSRGSTAIAAAADQIITFTRTGDDDTAVRGRLEIEGRFGPRLSLHIQLGDRVRWGVSDAVRTEPTNARDRILWLLKRGTPLTAKEIVVGIAGLELKTAQNTLANMLRESKPPIIYTGSGGKGDPRRYAAVENDFHDDS